MVCGRRIADGAGWLSAGLGLQASVGGGRPVTGSWWLRAAGCRHCFLIGGCLLVTGWWMAGCWVLNDCRLVRFLAEDLCLVASEWRQHSLIFERCSSCSALYCQFRYFIHFSIHGLWHTFTVVHHWVIVWAQ